MIDQWEHDALIRRLRERKSTLSSRCFSVMLKVSVACEMRQSDKPFNLVPYISEKG